LLKSKPLHKQLNNVLQAVYRHAQREISGREIPETGFLLGNLLLAETEGLHG
jgi:hypothetical protein